MRPRAVLQDLGVGKRLPIGFGVLAVDDEAQALDAGSSSARVIAAEPPPRLAWRPWP